MAGRIRFTVLAAAASLLVGFGSAAGQEREPAGWELTPYAGYVMFDDLVSGPLGTSLGAGNGPILGLQVSVDLVPGVKLYGHGAHASGSMRAGAPIIGGFDFGGSTAWLYDAGIELGLPRAGGPAPFVQVGAGGIHQRFEISGIGTDATSFAVNAGVGLDVPLGSRAGLRLMARDYIGRFDFQEAVAFDVDDDIKHNVAVTAGLRFSF